MNLYSIERDLWFTQIHSTMISSVQKTSNLSKSLKKSLTCSPSLPPCLILSTRMLGSGIFRGLKTFVVAPNVLSKCSKIGHVFFS